MNQLAGRRPCVLAISPSLHAAAVVILSQILAMRPKLAAVSTTWTIRSGLLGRGSDSVWGECDVRRRAHTITVTRGMACLVRAMRTDVAYVVRLFADASSLSCCCAPFFSHVFDHLMLYHRFPHMLLRRRAKPCVARLAEAASFSHMCSIILCCSIAPQACYFAGGRSRG